MAKVKEFTVETGLSIEYSANTWYKFRYAMTVELEEGDKLSEVKNKAWDVAYREVEKQLTELISSKNSTSEN